MAFTKNYSRHSAGECGVRVLGARISEAGDSAVVCGIDVQSVSTPAVDVNARAIAVAATVRQRSIAGVRDVVSTFRSVTVFFEPLKTDVSEVTAALRDGMTASLPDASSKTIDVPVMYGGDDGPDLVEVAAFARCSPETVITRHAERTYRVCMLGFMPGFPYMAPVDETIAMPRLKTPRVRVPAGSVGIAGIQTGIYPKQSPGGWRIIGRTAPNLFDPDRSSPALFSPGDRVRFVPADAVADFGFSRTETSSTPKTTATRYVRVLQPGLLTTVQDAGRWSHQHLGVSVAGPMDYLGHRLANALVGNGEQAATLETTWLGPELKMEQETRVAVAGADLGATLDGVDVPVGMPMHCHAGSVLRFGDRRSGMRAYIAFDGGIVVPPVLGSCATHLSSGLGGMGGRQLTVGDCLPLGDPGGEVSPQFIDSSVARFGASAAHPMQSAGGVRLRVLPGPEMTRSDLSALEALQRMRYTVSPESNRMGYRLTGGAKIPGVSSGDMISEATFVGAIQLPPSGDPILLMADRQTSGGYPQIAIVITADLPLAGQLGPGDWIEFETCSRIDAIAALRDMDEALGAAG